MVKTSIRSLSPPLPRLAPFAFLILSLLRSPETSDAIQLKTTSSRLVTVSTNGKTTGNSSRGSLQDFISRPIHWPEIVLSSNRVEVIKKEPTRERPPLSLGSFFRSVAPKNSKDNKNNGNEPVVKPASGSYASESLRVGDTVEEYFALNQFKVRWTCTKNEPGRLVVVSPDGLEGIATNCVMDFEFDVTETTNGASAAADESTAVVRLTMEYTPESPLAVLATPVLVVDNWLALNVLLPAAVDATPLDSFRKLMGILYGVAGAAHFLDLLVGGSQLFTTVVGIPSFENLDLLGQLYALLWCASGPIAYFLSATTNPASDKPETIPTNKADIGIVLYGIIEVVGAVLSSGIDGASSDVVVNAAGVQGIVLAAWIYSYQKQRQKQQEQLES